MTGPERVAYCGQIIESIKAMMEKPALRELTSDQMKTREDRRHDMAVSIKINGGTVRPEYRQ